MNESLVMDAARQGMQVGMMVSLPLLGVSLLVGIVVSVFQAVTQIQEPTVTYVPKLIAVCGVVLGMGAWMLQSLVKFTLLCFQSAGQIGQ